MELMDIEKSIIKKYRKDIWSKFIDGINEFKMINNGDSIAVCISGGKDSFLLAKCMQEIKKHGQIDFDLKFICMDPGYSEDNLLKIKENSLKLGIDLHIFNSDVFKVSNFLNEKSPCYMCARMRRGYLYDEAKKIGCNKIALGHHFDDVIETILLSLIYSGEMKTMMPKLHSTNFKGMELIRPLYYVKESDIINWAKYNNLEFINCACKFTEKSSSNSKRTEIKELINHFRKINPYIETNIMKSSKNVNLDTIIEYKKGEERFNFLDEYDGEN